MLFLNQTKVLPYSSEQIYKLIMDIESYPEFLPWCKQAKIIRSLSENELEADLLINFKSFFEKYRSQVKHGKIDDSQDYYINAIAIQGPFKKLINKWQITNLKRRKCQIDFFIEFEFNSKILTKLISPLFKKSTEKMTQAFENQAQKIYNM